MIYRVDSVSAEMTPFITLTASAPPSSANPYGVLGIAYDCDTNSLYASSIAGSTPDHEVGKLVRIDLATANVAAEYTGFDPFGINIYTLADGKRLYFGDTRSPQIFSVKLDSAGNFVGEPKPELALSDADFRAWRITFATSGNMQVRGREFDFNLIATGQAKEVQYTFHYDPAKQQWERRQ